MSLEAASKFPFNCVDSFTRFEEFAVLAAHEQECEIDKKHSTRRWDHSKGETARKELIHRCGERIFHKLHTKYDFAFIFNIFQHHVKDVVFLALGGKEEFDKLPTYQFETNPFQGEILPSRPFQGGRPSTLIPQEITSSFMRRANNNELLIRLNNEHFQTINVSTNAPVHSESGLIEELCMKAVDSHTVGGGTLHTFKWCKQSITVLDDLAMKYLFGNNFYSIPAECFDTSVINLSPVQLRPFIDPKPIWFKPLIHFNELAKVCKIRKHIFSLINHTLLPFLGVSHYSRVHPLELVRQYSDTLQDFRELIPHKKKDISRDRAVKKPVEVKEESASKEPLKLGLEYSDTLQDFRELTPHKKKDISHDRAVKKPVEEKKESASKAPFKLDLEASGLRKRRSKKA